MAQIGSHVPAQKVEMGLIDKVFTRVGASDNLSSGQSTFMVEMIETASILNNLSPRSLILLDEIGRGTSTYDGISIAWSIAEYLHTASATHPKTLFATHYHELNEMEKFFPRIRNFSIAVKDTGDRVIFLRKLIEGGSEHSFGIQVAKMAGIPPWVLSRAHTLLNLMEQGESPWTHTGSPKSQSLFSGKESTNYPAGDETQRHAIFQTGETLPSYLNEITKELKNLNLDHITPMEALMILSSLKKKADH
jgi:DNA mismatch repair protein MutS